MILYLCGRWLWAKIRRRAWECSACMDTHGWTDFYGEWHQCSSCRGPR